MIRHLLANQNDWKKGKLGSPEKMIAYYAGYTAMRSIWEARTNKGKVRTGDDDLDDKDKFAHRVSEEISHSVGKRTNTLFKVKKFKYWAEKILDRWG